MQQILFTYWLTPHASTNRSPSELFLGRRVASVLDRLKPDIKANMERAQLKQKLYHDQHSRPRSFYVDETVWVQRETGKGIIKHRVGELSYMVYVKERSLEDMPITFVPKLINQWI